MTADNLKALRELEKKNICDIDKSAGFFGGLWQNCLCAAKMNGRRS